MTPKLIQFNGAVYRLAETEVSDEEAAVQAALDVLSESLPVEQAKAILGLRNGAYRTADAQQDYAKALRKYDALVAKVTGLFMPASAGAPPELLKVQRAIAAEVDGLFRTLRDATDPGVLDNHESKLKRLKQQYVDLNPPNKTRNLFYVALKNLIASVPNIKSSLVKYQQQLQSGAKGKRVDPSSSAGLFGKALLIGGLLGVLLQGLPAAKMHELESAKINLTTPSRYDEPVVDSGKPDSTGKPEPGTPEYEAWLLQRDEEDSVQIEPEQNTTRASAFPSGSIGDLIDSVPDIANRNEFISWVSKLPDAEIIKLQGFLKTRNPKAYEAIGLVLKRETRDPKYTKATIGTLVADNPGIQNTPEWQQWWRTLDKTTRLGLVRYLNQMIKQEKEKEHEPWSGYPFI